MYFKHTSLIDKCLQTKLWLTVPKTGLKILQTSINTKTEIVLKRSNLTVESHWLWPLKSLGLNIFNSDKLKKYKIPFKGILNIHDFQAHLYWKKFKEKSCFDKSWFSNSNTRINVLKIEPSSLLMVPWKYWVLLRKSLNVWCYLPRNQNL